MLRDYRATLEDIAGAAEVIRELCAGVSRDELAADRQTRDAVIRNLEVIGEAVKKLPEEQRSRYADVEWKRTAGLRDILIHEYFGIDVDIIWEVVRTKLP